MGLTEDINNILINNLLSSSILGSIKFMVKSLPTSNSNIPPALQNLPVPQLVLQGNFFVRLAGFSGATAVALAVFGTHYLNTPSDKENKLSDTYLTANNYHFFSSLALLGVPLCKYQKITGSFLTAGMILHCGTEYYFSLTGKKSFKGLSLIGKSCLILGWLCFIL